MIFKRTKNTERGKLIRYRYRDKGVDRQVVRKT